MRIKAEKGGGQILRSKSRNSKQVRMFKDHSGSRNVLKFARLKTEILFQFVRRPSLQDGKLNLDIRTSNLTRQAGVLRSCLRFNAEET